MNVLPPHDMVDWLLSNGKLLAVLGAAVGVAILLVGLVRFVRGRASAAGKPRSSHRVKAFAARWQLVLLATTSVSLSLVATYTTWLGMTHFTGKAWLSLMVAFGIQGVMLITAWLIGESFAVGMNRQIPRGGGSRSGFDAVIGMPLALTVVAAAFYWYLYSTRVIRWSPTGTLVPINWTSFADVSVYFALALIVIAVVAFNFGRRGELSLPYVQSARIIIRNAILWVMFLACMTASVFFSFSAHFTGIFPHEERVRAAQLRAQNQVAGIIADIGTTIETRRLAEIDNLFGHKGWLSYETQLTKLASASQGAQREIERFFNSQIEERKRAITSQQERIASARSGSAGLQTKKTVLTEELARLAGERPSLAGDLAEKKSELENRARGVDAKRVEAQAESQGAEGTLKQGRGPIWRQRMGELSQLQAAYKIQEDRVRDAQKRLASVDVRIAQIKRELAEVDGSLAGLKAEAQTAEARIKLAEGQSAGEGLPRVDPARVLPAFEKARIDFRQEPTRERLAGLQQQCSNLHGALASTPATKRRVLDIECDPKQAAEAAAVMFALNDGISTFTKRCAGGDKIARYSTTDALWTFARACLADSGLPSKETDELRGRINLAELSRDDKAHPLVAAINAFQDSNRLAYLALGIALTIDTLVFMSGLFGANALRSPLSDVPSSRARSGRQLEDIIENALLPDKLDNARHVLNAMRPMTPRDGFTHAVVIPHGDPHAPDIRRALSAAATIGAVRQADTADERYEVRPELFEFLSIVAKRAFESSDENVRLAELRKVIAVALQPNIGDHADIVLHYCRPISERDGFSCEVYLSELRLLNANDAFVVQKALNAGSTLNYVLLDERKDQLQLERYYVHKQLYKTMLLLSAAYPKTGKRSYAPGIGAPQDQRRLAASRHGGDLTPKQSQITDDHARHRALPGFVDDLAAGAYGAPPSRPAEAQRAPAARGDDLSSRDYEDQFIARMVEALGVDPYAFVLIDGETFSAMLAASEAFEVRQRSNPQLSDMIRKKQRDALGTIDHIHDWLQDSAAAGSERGRDALDAAYGIVRNNLTGILLLPGGAIETSLKTLIQGLEAQSGAGKLNAEETDLLRLAKRLQEIVGRNARNSADEWRALAVDLQADHADQSDNVAIFTKQGARRQPG